MFESPLGDGKPELWATVIVYLMVLSLPFLARGYWRNWHARGGEAARFSWRRIGASYYKSPDFRHGHMRAGMTLFLLALTFLPFSVAVIRSDDPRWGQPFVGSVSLWELIFFGPLIMFLPGSIVLYWSIMLFNWPKVLVPPDLRDHPGVLAARRNKARLSGDPLADLSVLTDGFYDYAAAVMPDRRDDEVTEIVEGVARLGQGGVAKAIRRVAGSVAADVLCVYAERMAAVAVREKRQEALDRALVAAVVGGLGEGRRESVAAVALIEDAATRIGRDVQTLFSDVSVVVGHPGADQLARWRSLPADQRSIDKVGFTEKTDDSGFRYVASPR